MQKGEFPARVVGFELALYKQHKKKSKLQGLKQCLTSHGGYSRSLAAPQTALTNVNVALLVQVAR